MRLRYIGPDRTRDLPLPGGCLTFTRDRWVDLTVASNEARIPLHHLEVIAPALAEHPHWDLDLESKPPPKLPRKPKET